MPKTPKVSVIVPVYKAEKYIEKCARSLFEQTLDDIEYIFINDCTPDKSIEILHKVLEEYPKRKDQVKIIHHETNKGIATSRNTGLNATTGTYIIHCDSDDWVEPNMYETMYNKAVEGNYDIVSCDYFIDSKNNSIYKNQLSYKDNNEYIKAVLEGKIGSYLWNKLTKKERISSKTKNGMISMLIKEHYPLTGKPYPKRLIFKVAGYSCSSWHEKPTPGTAKRDRKPKHTDEVVLQKVQTEIKKSRFKAEGYIKVKKRMGKRNICMLSTVQRDNRAVSPHIGRTGVANRNIFFL